MYHKSSLPLCDCWCSLHNVVNKVGGEEGQSDMLQHLMETLGHTLLSLKMITSAINQSIKHFIIYFSFPTFHENTLA